MSYSREALTAALEYRARNWSVIPIRDSDKKPALKTWGKFQTEIADETTLKRWFSEGSRNRLGIVLGPVSQCLIARDFDRMESYRQWLTNAGQLAHLPTVETRRGVHLYALADWPLIESRTSSSYLTFDDGELRLSRCYDLAPPSIHESGKPYRWVNPLPPIGARLPTVDPWLIGWVPESFRESVYRETEDTQESQDSEESQDTEPLRTFEKECHLAANSKSKVVPTSIPLESYSREVQKRVREAIKATLPTETRKRHQLVFELARWLKAIPELAHLDGRALRPIVEIWHRYAKDFYRAGFVETWADFFDGWNKIRYAKGETPMTEAMKWVHEGPYPDGIDGELEEIKQLAALCRELQRLNGDAPFFLSTRSAGEVVNVNHVTANKLLNSFVRFGFLKVVEPGTQGANGSATRWRYTGPTAKRGS